MLADRALSALQILQDAIVDHHVTEGDRVCMDQTFQRPGEGSSRATVAAATGFHPLVNRSPFVVSFLLSLLPLERCQCLLRRQTARGIRRQQSQLLHFHIEATPLEVDTFAQDPLEIRRVKPDNTWVHVCLC